MNILIVRLGALGDIVHAVPAAAALRNAFPEARIDWLVDAKHRDMIDLVTVIDHAVVLERASIAGWIDVSRRMRSAGYDVAIDFQGLMKSAILARAIRRAAGDRVFNLAPAREDRSSFLFRDRASRERTCGRCRTRHSQEPVSPWRAWSERRPYSVSSRERRVSGADGGAICARWRAAVRARSTRALRGRTSAGRRNDSARSRHFCRRFAGCRLSFYGDQAKRVWPARSLKRPEVRRGWRRRPTWRICSRCRGPHR